MDINLPADLNSLVSGLSTGNNGLGLKLNQILDAKVIETQTVLNSFNLNVGGKILTVATPAPLNLQPGQSLQLQVVKIFPVPEFKIIAGNTIAAAQLALAPATGQTPNLKLLDPRSQVMPDAAGNPVLVMDVKFSQSNRGMLLSLPMALNLAEFSVNQTLAAKVINIPGGGNGYLLTIANKSLLLPVPAGLASQTGQTVQLQVVTVQPQTTLLQVNQGLAATEALSQSSRQTNVASLQTVMQQLTDAQALNAIVVKVAGNKITLQLTGLPNSQPMQVTLDAKQLLLQTTSGQGKLQLQAGTQINLAMLQAGKSPLFAATVLAEPVLSAKQINEILKQLLPIQNSPVELLNYLQQNLSSLQLNPSVAESLKALAQQILATLPDPLLLANGNKLQEKLANSGLFLESKLAALLAGNSNQNLTADFKFNLLKLSEALHHAALTQTSAFEVDTLLKTLLQKTDGSLAKLTLDQFASIPHDDAVKQAWVFELPFTQHQHTQSVSIEIEQYKHSHAGNEEGPAKNWAVSITLTPPELATIHCRVSCYDGAINTRFWSDTADTVTKITAHLPYLQQQFALKGLQAGFMEAHQGKPSHQDVPPKSPLNLLNEKV